MRRPLIDYFEYALIALAVIASALFVIVGADRSIWLDEANSVLIAHQNFQGVLQHLRLENNLPLYYLILHPWMIVFGDSEAACRALSGVFYLATIITTFFTGYSLRLGWRAATYGAFFYLVSIQAVHQAQNIRMYAMLGFLASLSIFFCLRLVCSARLHTHDGIALILVNILGCFTHMWFFFLVGAEVVGIFVSAPRKLAVVSAGCAVVPVVPFALLWGQTVMDQLGDGATNWMPAFRWSFVPDIFVRYYGGFVPGFFAYAGIIFLVYRTHPASIVAFMRERYVRFILATFCTAIVLAMTVCVFRPIYWPGRYTIIALPALAILLGIVLVHFSSRYTLLLLCYGLLAWTVVHHIHGRHQVPEAPSLPQGQDDRITAQYLLEHAKKGDVLLFTSLSRLAVEYYIDRSDCSLCFHKSSFPSEIDTHPSWRISTATSKERPSLEIDAEQIVAQSAQLAGQHGGSVWVLYGSDPSVSEILKRRLDSHLVLEQQLDLHGPFHTSVLKYRGGP